jgi:hypothetical protein
MEARDALDIIIQFPSEFLAKNGQNESRVIANLSAISGSEVVGANFVVPYHLDANGY